MHSCFTSCIFAARTLDFALKFRLVFRHEAVVFRRYVLALLSVGLLRKFEAYLVYLSLNWTKNPRRFSFFKKFLHFTYMLLWFSRANWWHAQSFFSSVRATMLRLGMRTCSIFNAQHLATPLNRVAKSVQHVAPSSVAICRVQMLWSFGRSLQMLGQLCRDMLCWNVAIVWPERNNTFSFFCVYVLVCVRACVRVCMVGFGHECVCISLFLISFNILSFVYFFFSPPPADQLCKSSHAYTIQVTNIHWQQF